MRSLADRGGRVMISLGKILPTYRQLVSYSKAIIFHHHIIHYCQSVRRDDMLLAGETMGIQRSSTFVSKSMKSNLLEGLVILSNSTIMDMGLSERMQKKRILRYF